MYDKYLLFIVDEEKRKMAIDVLKSQWDPIKYPTDEEIERMLLQGFIAENMTHDYNVGNCILLDFPLTFIANILEKFVKNPYAYAWNSDEEIAKLIYHLWPKYIDQSDNKISECLQTLKSKMLEFRTLDTYEKICDAARKNTPHLSPARYYNWHIFAFFSLLGDDGILILMNVIKQYYDDAQDMLMFGLAQYNPQIFLPTFSEILEYWHKNQNISFSTGTGMITELKNVIKEYNRQGVNVYKNDKIKGILEHYKIFEKDVLADLIN